MTSTGDPRWPGDRLGLPESGPRSVARLGRRLLAIVIDWAIATGLSLLLFREAPWQTNGFVTLGIFAVLQLAFIVFFNGGIGHLLLGMRVVPITGGRLAPWRPVVRTALLCLFVPAIVMDVDQRGWHDRAAGTILVRV